MHGPETDIPSRLVILGCGHMGSAIARGVLAGVLPPSRLVLIDAEAAKLTPFAERGVATATEIGGVVLGPTDVLLLAMKPQGFGPAVPELRAMLRAGTGVVSIMAGITLARLAQDLGTRRLVRVMPNLPAALGQGATAMAAVEGADEALRRFVKAVFESVGPVVVPVAEGLMDPFTALAGSGPAYVFYLGEAMVQAAVTQGFAEADARRVVRQVLIGSAAMLAGDERGFEALRAAVTSKGGVTQAACEVLDRAEVREAMSRAIAAGAARGRELAGS